MWITITSVGIAMVAAFVITRSVTAATKHSDRRRRERGEPLPNEGGALVTVRLRTFQWVLIRVVAIIFLLDILKLVRVFFRLPPLELVVPRPFPQTTRQSCLLRIRPATTLHSLAQTLLELFLPLPLLVLLSALPFLIQTFLAAPLVPCDFLHLL